MGTAGEAAAMTAGGGGAALAVSGVLGMEEPFMSGGAWLRG